MARWIVGQACAGGLALLLASGCGECWMDVAVLESAGHLLVISTCRSQGSVYLAPLDDPGRGAVRIREGDHSRASGSADGQFVFATTQASSRLVSFDLAGRTSTTGPRQGALGRPVPWSRGQGVWVPVWAGASGVSLVDMARGVERAFVPLPGAPYGLAAWPEEDGVVAASSDPGRVVDIDPVRLVERASAETSGALDLALLPAPRRVVLLEDQARRLSVRDGATLAVLAELPLGEEPRRVAASPDGRFLAVTERAEGTLRVFDGPTLAELGQVQLDGAPEALALSRDGRAFVASSGDGALAVVELATLQVTGGLEL